MQKRLISFNYYVTWGWVIVWMVAKGGRFLRSVAHAEKFQMSKMSSTKSWENPAAGKYFARKTYLFANNT